MSLLVGKTVANVRRIQATDGSSMFNIELCDSTTGRIVAVIGMDGGHAAQRLADALNDYDVSWVEGRAS